MTEALIVRLLSFSLAFLTLAGLEFVAPRRVRTLPRAARWPHNLALVALNSALLRVLLPLGAVGGAIWANQAGWGLLRVIDAPAWIAVPASILLLDLAIYLQHIALHRVPVLWRLHRMHHADLDLDVTSGLRFHPLEMVLSLLFKLSVVVALGAPAEGVLLFEVLLNATAMFNHSNIRLPSRLEQPLRWVIVTPDMHRIHHSVRSDETDSNFGFNAPWWDRLFRTYRSRPCDGQIGMTLGLLGHTDPAEQHLHRMLRAPFINEGGRPPAAPGRPAARSEGRRLWPRK